MKGDECRQKTVRVDMSRNLMLSCIFPPSAGILENMRRVRWVGVRVYVCTCVCLHVCTCTLVSVDLCIDVIFQSTATRVRRGRNGCVLARSRRSRTLQC